MVLDLTSATVSRGHWRRGGPTLSGDSTRNRMKLSWEVLSLWIEV